MVRADTGLPVQIHFLVVFFVIAGGNVVHPLLVIEIPTDGFLNAFLEPERGLPAYFCF
jgi:hypothetical protein